MSSRALRKLRGTDNSELDFPLQLQDGLNEIVDDQDVVPLQSSKKSRKKTARNGAVNPFDVVHTCISF